MKNIFKKNIIKKLSVIIFLIYVIVIFINQQKTLNSYSSQKTYYSHKIDEANEYNETLTTTIANLDSDEYIKAISRKKLDMYLPGERVYININE